MKPIFTPEDFALVYKEIMKDGFWSRGAGEMWEPSCSPGSIADVANEKLNKLIESWSVVYGKNNQTTFFDGRKNE